MMNKRLMTCLAIFSLFSLPAIAASDVDNPEFKKFEAAQKKEFEQYALSVEEEFSEFVALWQEAEAEYKTKILSTWQEAKLPTNKVWVGYSKNLNKRTTVDFEKQELIIELQRSTNVRQQIEQTVSELTVSSKSQLLVQDPVITKVQTKLKDSKHKLVIKQASEPLIAKQFIATEKQKVTTQKNGIIQIRIPLRSDLLDDNARKYFPLAKTYGEKWGLPTPLILAIIHTESSFNPLARSHIPAFGLMQIVPTSAGKDITKFLNGKVELLPPSVLLQPERNIEAGSVYLHLLFNRYFKGVNEYKSKLYMSVAAYNTGPGNVARALTSTKSLTKARAAANQKTSDEIYYQLLENLPYQETVKYLDKVIKRTNHYQTILSKEAT